jgi:hypothetical protein
LTHESGYRCEFGVPNAQNALPKIETQKLRINLPRSGIINAMMTAIRKVDETATAALLHLGSSGNVQTSTARTFSAAEMGKILSKLSK